MASILASKRLIKGLKLSETTWRGIQPAWKISGDKLDLILTKHGLNIHIAKVHRKKDDEDYNVNDDDGFLHECTYKNCYRCFESARAL